jgi:prepilin-type N-terminal cleavage/methylation domain-containing protein
MQSQGMLFGLENINVKQHFMTMKNPISPQSTAKPYSRRGFTLIEILVVVAIISILLTAGITSLGNLSAGKGTSAAVAACESIFAEARNIAISKGCRARVLIDMNNPGNENYLRRVVVVHEQIAANGTPVANTWVMPSRGYVMPQGTFFSQISSIGQAAASFTNPELKAAFHGNYAYYEFNAEGIAAAPGAMFVVGTGVRAPGAANPRTTASSASDFGGFSIFRNGTTGLIRNPSQITLPSSNNF